MDGVMIQLLATVTNIPFVDKQRTRASTVSPAIVLTTCARD